MTIRSILMNIKVKVLGLEKPLFLLISTNHEGGCEGVLPMGREREAEATNITSHVASAVMYRMMFELLVDLDDIAQFIRFRFSHEHVKVAMQHSSYDTQSRKVVLHHTSDFDIDNDMRDMVGEDWIDMLIFETTAALDVGAIDSGVIFDHDNDGGSPRSVTTSIFMNNNNTPDRAECSNTTNRVNSFAAASNLKWCCIPKWGSSFSPGQQRYG